jgi:hypothetical protein
MLRTKIGATFAVLLSVSASSSESRAGLVSLCEWQPNIDYECRDCTPTSNNLPVAIFNYPNAGRVTDLTQIEFTMSMQVGDPQTSNLTLGIDGIDTGIALTGFERDSLVEKTFAVSEGDANWISPEKESEILAALADGEVFASIMGATPDDLKVQLYSDTNVQLCITGTEPDQVPEPASILAWTAAGLIAFRRRRKAV